MGKWNNAQFLCSDEIAAFVRMLSKDYREDDFETFRSRLLYMIDRQLEVKGILNEAVPDIKEIKDSIAELKSVYELQSVSHPEESSEEGRQEEGEIPEESSETSQQSPFYPEDKELSITFSDEELEKLAQTVADRLGVSDQNSRLDELMAKLARLEAPKAQAVPPAVKIPDYSPDLKQILKIVLGIQEQNQEILKKVDAGESSREPGEDEDSENELVRLREENRSLSSALNKYKTLCVKLNNDLTDLRREQNEIRMYMDKLRKEVSIRVKRQELQDALLARKDKEIAALQQENEKLNADKS